MTFSWKVLTLNEIPDDFKEKHLPKGLNDKQQHVPDFLRCFVCFDGDDESKILAMCLFHYAFSTWQGKTIKVVWFGKFCGCEIEIWQQLLLAMIKFAKDDQCNRIDFWDNDTIDECRYQRRFLEVASHMLEDEKLAKFTNLFKLEGWLLNKMNCH